MIKTTELFSLLLMLLFLSSCTTKAVVNGLACNPPEVVIKKAEPLSLIKQDKFSMHEMFNQMVEDSAQYNMLRAKDDTLIKWVKDHCGELKP